ncbi:DUF805 domain-containing protein [Oryzicola mucosus]|uniref:DUF805 domain-containing protein n=1 Tax=Oryzicola mucosus TaxID=2767425 RepID=A0A8J6PM21_9HYPH|nr:DUF805 domain-containing protein [Oryzicola mucosus]MBD0414052.1 DUF805 domain-containing protein [Oryzicola mucosus]
MRGEVLHFDEAQGFGFISGADGNRYGFAHEDLRVRASLSKGTQVEFQPSGGQAKDVFVFRPHGHSAVPQVPTQFGRHADPQATVLVQEPAAGNSTGLWSFFWRGLTSNYANFQGRARRKEFWGYFLFYYLGIIVLLFAGLLIDAALGNFHPEIDTDSVPVVTMVVLSVFVLGTIIPGIAMTVRRQHDIGLSGWFYLLILIPSIGGLIIFVFSLIPSQKHDNRWGPVPAGITIPPPYVPVAQA